MRAIAAHQSGDELRALEHLVQALDLAAEEDYRRVFLDEDSVVLELLPRLRPRLEGTPARAFVVRLLADYDSERHRTEGDRPTASSSPSSRPQPLPVEQLTARELEVLHLLAEGLTTPEIANRLYISAGTAKWHTINIYRKLGVHNRVQAVTHAQEWGLI